MRIFTATLLASLLIVMPATAPSVVVHDPTAEASRLKQLRNQMDEIAKLARQIQELRRHTDLLTGNYDMLTKLRSLSSVAGHDWMDDIWCGGTQAGASPGAVCKPIVVMKETISDMMSVQRGINCVNRPLWRYGGVSGQIASVDARMACLDREAQHLGLWSNQDRDEAERQMIEAYTNADNADKKRQKTIETLASEAGLSQEEVAKIDRSRLLIEGRVDAETLQNERKVLNKANENLSSDLVAAAGSVIENCNAVFTASAPALTGPSKSETDCSAPAMLYRLVALTSRQAQIILKTSGQLDLIAGLIQNLHNLHQNHYETLDQIERARGRDEDALEAGQPQRGDVWIDRNAFEG